MTPVAGITSTITDAIANHGLAAVFVLMALDALIPVGGELVMLYAGVIAAGVVAGSHVGLLGLSASPGLESYVVLALGGTLGYLGGSLLGWALGRSGGRPLLERHGHLLHLPPARVIRAERWFDRHGDNAVLLGRVTPLVRSFISVPAGVFGIPLRPYALLTLLGSAIWCFAFAGAGWALGGSWESFHSAFKYVDVLAVAAVVAAVAVLVGRPALARRR